MDPVEILQLLAGSAVVAALVSGAVSEWRSRQAEKRAVKREEAADRRTDERERKRDRRDLLLRQIDETQSDHLGSMDWLMYRALGSREHMDKTLWGDQHWPQAQWYLIGDESLLSQVFEFRTELSARPQGSGFSAADVARMGALRGHVSSRLENQRERVRNGEEPLWPTSAFVKSMLDQAGAEYGIPSEFQPKLKD